MPSVEPVGRVGGDLVCSPSYFPSQRRREKRVRRVSVGTLRTATLSYPVSGLTDVSELD